MTQDEIAYRMVQTAEELGRQVRTHHKQRRLALETVSGSVT